MDTSLTPGTSVPDPGAAASLGTPSRRWRWLRVALAVVFSGTTLRYFGANRLHTPAGRFWGLADDVYVSADFARTFVEGHGLVWYPGAPRVEGFSNPLWVLLLAVLHRLPGFTETRLGLYLGIFNLCLMAVLGVTTAVVMERVPGVRPPTWSRGLLVCVLAFFACLSLYVCVGEGFETGAVCLFGMAALAEALAPQVRPLRVALLVSLAFWTRIDAVLACWPALWFTATRARDRRAALIAAGTLVALCAVQFPLRRWYYGEWLPNTYYLKATGWAAKDRLPQGILMYHHVLGAALFAVAGLGALGRWLGASRRVVWTAISAHLVTIGYAINNGSDLLYVYGFDRYSAVGTLFLALALSVAALTARPPRLVAALATTAALSTVLAPLFMLGVSDGLTSLRRIADLRRRAFVRDRPLELWVHQGQLLGEVTGPGARIALCPAGAIIYFSHRGGVDLLGKVEPIVARGPATTSPPPEARCWRGFPGGGHNKENTPAVFAARQPDLSLVAPPKKEARRFVHFRYSDLEFYARRGSPYVRWSEGSVVH